MFYQDPFLKDHLLPDIIPGLIALGAIEPNKYREIEGDSLLERATTALDTLRSGQVSGEMEGLDWERIPTVQVNRLLTLDNVHYYCIHDKLSLRLHDSPIAEDR